jgi:hypothetical protein
MEPEGSISDSQELSSCSYPEPDILKTMESKKIGYENGKLF